MIILKWSIEGQSNRKDVGGGKKNKYKIFGRKPNRNWRGI